MPSVAQTNTVKLSTKITPSAMWSPEVLALLRSRENETALSAERASIQLFQKIDRKVKRHSNQ